MKNSETTVTMDPGRYTGRTRDRALCSCHSHV